MGGIPDGNQHYEIVMAKATEGCCADESWRGHYCQYHQGFLDGIYAAEEWAD